MNPIPFAVENVHDYFLPCICLLLACECYSTSPYASNISWNLDVSSTIFSPLLVLASVEDFSSSSQEIMLVLLL
jgi:hypothetical protein